MTSDMERENKKEREDKDDFDFTDVLLEEIMKKPRKIFRNRERLLPAYIPKKPMHREKQIRILVDLLKPCFRSETPSNLFIYGKTGTGKTLITRYVCKKIIEKCNQYNILPPFISYINAQAVNTKYRALRRICEDIGVQIPENGLSSDYIFERLKKKLKDAGKNLIIIIDEIDKLIKSRGYNNLLYLLTRLSEENPSIGTTIIGISNDIRLKEFLDVRVLSSMNAQELVFPPYKRSELISILKERARDAFFSGVCSNFIIESIASIAASEHGDARKAIALLLKVGEVAERKDVNLIEPQHILQAKDELEFDTIEGFVLTLPIQHKIVLIAISNARHYLKLDLNTGSLLRVYRELVNASDRFVSTFGEARLLQIMKELENYGLVNLEVISRGKRGRSTIAHICLDRKTIERIFSKEPELRKLLNYKPKITCLDNFIRFK
ncbi:MAG: Cdc6/Cdc18 family protein [Promethearchaeota archaeon]